MKVGVVAVQGDVSEHVAAFESAGEELDLEVESVQFRSSGVVPECDVVAVPGGESTTISDLLKREGIGRELVKHVDDGGTVFATCAGLIVLSRGAGDKVDTLDLLDVEVERNAFGRQKDSFEAYLDVSVDEQEIEDFPAVFIRAPMVEEVGGDAEVISRFGGDVVAVKQGEVLGTSFHPELTGDYRLHHYVLESAVE
ncbi:MAG: pyridoxal 5'-phosphate synthase glutaminase subunit PdxT [Halobacteria archaeon]